MERSGRRLPAILWPYQNRFAQIASLFEFKDNKEAEGNRNMAWYSPELVPQLITAYNELLGTHNWLETSYSKYKNPIDRFISSNVFAEILTVPPHRYG